MVLPPVIERGKKAVWTQEQLNAQMVKFQSAPRNRGRTRKVRLFEPLSNIILALESNENEVQQLNTHNSEYLKPAASQGLSDDKTAY